MPQTVPRTAATCPGPCPGPSARAPDRAPDRWPLCDDPGTCYVLADSELICDLAEGSKNDPILDLYDIKEHQKRMQSITFHNAQHMFVIFSYFKFLVIHIEINSDQ